MNKHIKKWLLALFTAGLLITGSVNATLSVPQLPMQVIDSAGNCFWISHNAGVTLYFVETQGLEAAKAKIEETRAPREVLTYLFDLAKYFDEVLIDNGLKGDDKLMEADLKSTTLKAALQIQCLDKLAEKYESKTGGIIALVKGGLPWINI